MNPFEKFIEYVLDEKKKISNRVALVIIIIISLFLIDNVLGFSYSYVNNNKIEQLSKLNSIINDAASDEVTIKISKELRNEIIYRKNYLQKFENSISSISDSYINSRPEDYGNKPTGFDPNLNKPNKGWFYVTAGGIYFIIAILIIPIIIFSDKSSTIIQRIVMALLLFSMFAGIGVFFTWIFGFIPQLIENEWLYNYILNGFLQFGIIFCMFYYTKKVNY